MFQSLTAPGSHAGDQDELLAAGEIAAASEPVRVELLDEARRSSVANRASSVVSQLLR